MVDLEGVSSQKQTRFERATRSLATLVCSHHSLRSLAPQLCSLALFTGSLTHFAHSFMGQLKFMNMCSRCNRVSREEMRFSSSLETRPQAKIEFSDVSISRHMQADQRTLKDVKRWQHSHIYYLGGENLSSCKKNSIHWRINEYKSILNPSIISVSSL